MRRVASGGGEVLDRGKVGRLCLWCADFASGGGEWLVVVERSWRKGLILPTVPLSQRFRLAYEIPNLNLYAAN
jgi:hypothetical protein